MAQQFKSELEAAKAEAKSATEKAAAAEAKSAEQANQIKNLDESVKAQQAIIEGLKKMREQAPKSYAKMIRESLEEHKDAFAKFMTEAKNGGAQQFNVELKLATGDITLPTVGASVRSLEVDPVVHALPILNNAFLLAFGVTGTDTAAFNWIEASDTKVVGYVAEMAANSNASSVTFTEKNRKFAKLATYFKFSSEMQNWFEALVDYATNRVDALLDAEFDSEVWNGQGNDSAKPNEIYGIKSVATAFSKLATYTHPTIGDVLIDAIAQINAKGYAANVAVVSYEGLAALRAVKDTSGHYLYNEMTGMFNQLRIIPSTNVATKEILIADNRCADIKKGRALEIEFTREAATDSWRVDFRRRAQVKVTTPDTKGLIYVADYETAIAAITPAAA